MNETPRWLTEHTHEVAPQLIGLPQRFEQAVVAQVPVGPLRDLVINYYMRFWDHAAKGLGPLVLGPTGSWKSYAMAVMARPLSQHIAVEWVNCPVQLRSVCSQRFTKESQDLIRRWTRVGVLVMDDFAAIAPKTQERDVMESVLASRWADQRPTWWTGNMVFTAHDDPQQVLRDRFGDLMARRFMDGSTGLRLMTV